MRFSPAAKIKYQSDLDFLGTGGLWLACPERFTKHLDQAPDCIGASTHSWDTWPLIAISRLCAILTGHHKIKKLAF